MGQEESILWAFKFSNFKVSVRWSSGSGQYDVGPESTELANPWPGMTGPARGLADKNH